MPEQHNVTSRKGPQQQQVLQRPELFQHRQLQLSEKLQAGFGQKADLTDLARILRKPSENRHI